MRQLCRKYGCLEGVETSVMSKVVISIFGNTSLIAKCAYFICQFCVVRNYSPTVTICSQVLGWEKAKCSCMTKRTDALFFVPCAMRLASVFDNSQGVLLCERHKSVHIYREPIEV